MSKITKIGLSVFTGGGFTGLLMIILSPVVAEILLGIAMIGLVIALISLIWEE